MKTNTSNHQVRGEYSFSYRINSRKNLLIVTYITRTGMLASSFLKIKTLEEANKLVFQLKETGSIPNRLTLPKCNLY